ncbi:hypothetical protein [Nostocoides jenkinsii]|uniref:Lipoprotein n=1 Tax=Nostocoides jenkinsii Ben 74 TaxID=1193518 RepID=A0A077MGH5_9MICO|nr:hypothetical protein [Tetrasphaera jenkinsii]CCI54472.1 exported hypothetical protein [Tetrasphaera jenkinsii Ben 74]
MRKPLVPLVAAACMLSLAGCGGEAAKPSGKDVSISAVTKGTADQACADLFGKASGIGAKFGENEFTWVGNPMYEDKMSCTLTPVGKKAADGPLHITMSKSGAAADADFVLGEWKFDMYDGGEGEWSDTQKKAVQDLIEAAAPHVKN